MTKMPSFDVRRFVAQVVSEIQRLDGSVQIDRVHTRSWSEFPLTELLLRAHESEGVQLLGFRVPADVRVPVSYTDAMHVRSGHDESETLLSHFYDIFDDVLDGTPRVVLAEANDELAGQLVEVGSFGELRTVRVYLRVEISGQVLHAREPVPLDHLFDEDMIGDMIEVASRASTAC